MKYHFERNKQRKQKMEVETEVKSQLKDIKNTKMQHTVTFYKAVKQISYPDNSKANIVLDRREK